MLDMLTSGIWKIATGAAVLVCVGLGVALWIERSDVADLTSQINDPKTGYIVRLSQSEANTTTLKAAIDDANAKVDALAAESAQKIAEAQVQVEAARGETVAATVRATQILDFKPTSTDACKALGEVDKQFTESLK
jgi:hypothetical protein